MREALRANRSSCWSRLGREIRQLGNPRQGALLESMPGLVVFVEGYCAKQALGVGLVLQ